MFTFIIKNVVKSYANDLTLIAATQIALLKKIIVYMEEKYLLFATLFTNSDWLQVSHTIWTLRNVSHSVCYSYDAVLQTEWYFWQETSRTDSASRGVYQTNGLLHERMWNLGAEKVWKNSGITKTDQKTHRNWGNTHKTFV